LIEKNIILIRRMPKWATSVTVPEKNRVTNWKMKINEKVIIDEHEILLKRMNSSLQTRGFVLQGNKRESYEGKVWFRIRFNKELIQKVSKLFHFLLCNGLLL
jgi:hypothetical protein